MDNRLLTKLLDVPALLAQSQTLEEGLSDLARMTAQFLKAGRCSVMLLTAGDDETVPSLHVCSHFGDLPDDAYRHAVPLDQGIAGYVLRTRQPLLIEDISRSAFSDSAWQSPATNPSLLSSPIQVATEVIGVINLSKPLDRGCFSRNDLQLLKVFSFVVGQAIQVFQLQKLAESHLLQMAEVLRRREAGGPGIHPISPDPFRLTKMVAKSFYRELSAAGFGQNDIIAIASEVLSQLNESITKHRIRMDRERARSDT